MAGDADSVPAETYPVGGLSTAVHNMLYSPNAVAGANDWDCEPSPEHPEPVVLVPATLSNMGGNWAALSPMLANAGYCVYSFNYGMNGLSLGRFGGLTDISGSARTMSEFVDRVLAATGAEKVDVVGHSQGGMMPHYYVKRLGGADTVDDFVALAPSNHGTTSAGLLHLRDFIDPFGIIDVLLTRLDLAGLAQQAEGSRFQTALFGDGDTVPGPHYTVIQTRNDKVVTPYTNAFLDAEPGTEVTNILLQDQCPNDPVGHMGLFLDGPALQHVINALGDGPADFRPSCTDYGPRF
ncbi:alpha/beta fold hydrolase [Streptomyces chumphonensis]|uniref:lipase family alpha/beta hydrolase n=1 Tax=Streptomyces chumphonensis TaxID=1214925 RepID=UPI002965643C|nr:alpha/beta fold hydrolase [Streptomyces chumphonensis]